jgi:hypothetical protein
MKNPARWTAALAAAVLVFCGPLAAEVPPLPKEQLEKRAELVITGKVTRLASADVNPPPVGMVRSTTHRLTVEIGKVTKGKPKDPPKPGDTAKPIVAVGTTNALKPGTTGSSGHYSTGPSYSLSNVKEGWELKLYLKARKDGEYDILFPNGFQVVKQPEEKKGDSKEGDAEKDGGKKQRGK